MTSKPKDRVSYPRKRGVSPGMTAQRLDNNAGRLAIDIIGGLRRAEISQINETGLTFFAEALDRAERRIRAEYHIQPTPQEAYDAALDQRVKEILQGEPFKSLDEKMEADAELFRKAMKDLDFQHHQHWEIMGFKEVGIREPPRGDPSCKGAFDLWMEKRRVDPIPPALVAIETERSLLDSMYSRHMAELKVPKVIPVVVTGQGVEPEEEPE